MSRKIRHKTCWCGGDAELKPVPGLGDAYQCDRDPSHTTTTIWFEVPSTDPDLDAPVGF